MHRCVTLPGHVVNRRGRAPVPNGRRVALGRPLFGVGVVGLPTLQLAARFGPMYIRLASPINPPCKNQTLFEHVLIRGWFPFVGYQFARGPKCGVHFRSPSALYINFPCTIYLYHGQGDVDVEWNRDPGPSVGPLNLIGILRLMCSSCCCVLCQCFRGWNYGQHVVQGSHSLFPVAVASCFNAVMV